MGLYEHILGTKYMGLYGIKCINSILDIYDVVGNRWKLIIIFLQFKKSNFYIFNFGNFFVHYRLFNLTS
ncbi:hypothetical protein BpHYR1_019031 [Brachionus plicatilis]|uniref:Uncharacterized protein n=1 Tax=Brachionus plicatilis TaxID=10195 RepID=A0A3M7SFX4_BRAPC|nr:hypothetical protein BpHYR1_019031 [Brachionus plicatilis]